MLLDLVSMQSHSGMQDIVDSSTGQILRGHLVQGGRSEEIVYLKNKDVYIKMPTQAAHNQTGTARMLCPLGGHEQGDDAPNYRSRLVAKDIRKKGENTIFAPPPLEALRALRSRHFRSVDDRTARWEGESQLQVSFIDIRRAYFNARMDHNKPVLVHLPPEDPDLGKGLCGRLNVHTPCPFLFACVSAHAPFHDLCASLCADVCTSCAWSCAWTGLRIRVGES